MVDELPERIRWTLTEWWTDPDPERYVLHFTTDYPVHLWLWLSPYKYTFRLRGTDDRGVDWMHYPTFGFTSEWSFEQTEPGDTTQHTFDLRDWPILPSWNAYFDARSHGRLTASNNPLLYLAGQGSDVRYMASSPSGMTEVWERSPNTPRYPRAYYAVANRINFISNDRYRTVMHFTLKYRPPGSECVKAYLRLYQYLYVWNGYGGQTAMYDCPTWWQQETATWNYPWAAPGGDYDPSTLDLLTWIRGQERHFFDVTDMVHRQTQLANVVNVLLRHPTEPPFPDREILYLYEHDYAPIYKRPTLFVWWSRGHH